MARQYSQRTFLRQTPNAVLKEYFAGKGLLGEVDFDALAKETDIEAVSEAIEALPDAQRDAVEADFEQVNELACAKGVEAVLEEAAFRNLDWAQAFSEMRNHYERAFRAFLDEGGLFYVAGHFDEMDRLGSWERRTIYKNLEPKIEQDDLDALAAAMSSVYRPQGRGRYCSVDNYLRHGPERHCYFVYPEDHPVTEPTYEGGGGKLRQVPRRPVFELIFVYRPEDGVLELSAKGNREHKEDLMRVFCQTILGLDELPEPDPVPDYDLSALKNRDTAFPTDPEDGVDSVELKMLRLDLPGGRSRRVTFEASPSPNAPQALHDLIDEALNTNKVSLDHVHAARARLRMTFAARNGGRQKRLTFEVAHPNRCTLKDDKYDQIAKKCLQRWGIARE
jgi:hypothetical protein